LLHRIAIAQALPDALDNSYGDRQQILNFATQVAPEDVQLFYQIALMGQKDLEISLVARTAFEMTLLRMLAFKPQGVVDVPTKALTAAEPMPTPATNHVDDSESAAYEPIAPASTEAHHVPEQAAPSYPAEDVPPVQEPSSDAPTMESTPEKKSEAQVTPRLAADALHAPEQHAPAAPREQESNSNAASGSALQMGEEFSESIPDSSEKPVAQRQSFSEFRAERWPELFAQLPLSGVLKLIASNLQCINVDDGSIVFKLDEVSSATFHRQHIQQLSEVLSAFFEQQVSAHIDIAALNLADGETPAQRRERLNAERRQRALEDLKQDPVVQHLQQQFGAQLREDSINIDEVRQ
jgi:DNA polymerase-3 subunit gamma/tau